MTASKKHGTSSKRKQSLQSGFSLLARGEPKVWFTGGMLVVCLAMITWLLALILYSGLPSFWPQPVDLLTLNDGTMDVGQYQTSEDIDSEESVGDGLRRNFRTGNVDFTGRHYRWLEPQELSQDGIGRPEFALVIERLEYGRLYGLPLTITENMLLSDATQLQIAQLTAIDSLLSSTAAENEAVATQVREGISGKISEIRNAEFRSRIEALAGNGASTEKATVWFQDAEGQWHSTSQLGPADTVLAVRSKWSEDDSISLVLPAKVELTSRLRSQRERLKYDVSQLDGELSELRVDVRRAELATDTATPVVLDSAHYLLEQQARLEKLPEEIAGYDALLKQSLDADLATKASAQLDSYRTTTLREELETNSQQLATWKKPLANAPEPIRDAIDRYQLGFLEILRKKRPLEQKLEELESQLQTLELTVAVPTNTEPVGDLTPEMIANVLNGQIDEQLIPLLNSGSDELVPSVDVEQLGDHSWLIRAIDTAGQRHLFAVTDSGYLGDSGTERRLLRLPERPFPIAEIVRSVEVNRLTLGQKAGVYVSRWREFLFDNPREANTEGGVFPAIWGTVVMTLIMTIAVLPFGVMAALYLREYTKSGPLVSLIRISINNLAGVPSIVYGVFGLSFFCYTIGSFLDGGAKNADIAPLPSTAWFIGVGVLAIAGTSAFFCSFASSGPSHTQTPTKRWLARIALVLWLGSVAGLAVLVLKSPLFDGFYREYLPSPTFGKGGLLWASLTLALLTLPVVIVATEEALAAVPNSLREGSLACGASKWQTIHRIVLPHARPGILTGAILAMARGAGEVAPLMLVGALPSAPDLPLDTEFPFFHGSRSFMHLGYQIYTLGFQSQNSDAAKPMVFTCTLLLILIVATLNISAIYLRARLRKRFQGSQF